MVRLALDPLFPPVDLQTTGKRVPAWDILPENRFELVFDERIDGPQLADYTSQCKAIHEISKRIFEHFS
jgi:hypothetical protein